MLCLARYRCSEYVSAEGEPAGRGRGQRLLQQQLSMLLLQQPQRNLGLGRGRKLRLLQPRMMLLQQPQRKLRVGVGAMGCSSRSRGGCCRSSRRGSCRSGQAPQIAAAAVAEDATGRGQGHRLPLQPRRMQQQLPQRKLRVRVGVGARVGARVSCNSNRACCYCNSRKGIAVRVGVASCCCCRA